MEESLKMNYYEGQQGGGGSIFSKFLHGGSFPSSPNSFIYF